MKSWTKALLFISLSLLCLFTCIGYAQFADVMRVNGTAQSQMPEGLFITNIAEVSTSNVEKNEFSAVPATTNIENHVKKSAPGEAASITYVVTVFNNTNTTYCYSDVVCLTGLDEYNGNNYISDTAESTGIFVACVFDGQNGSLKTISPQSYMVLNVVYTIGSEISESIDLSMLVNLRFGVNILGKEEALGMLETRFLEILNTPATYEYLVDVLDNKYDGANDWTSNYVGNVVGATTGAFSEDSVAVNSLFQNHLQLSINGELKEVTVIIKHENIDWDNGTGDYSVATHPSGAVQTGTGCEMVLYLTMDDLDVPGEYVTVYAMIFSCDRDWQTGAIIGDWYHIGDIFEGKAEVADYDGTVGGTGSFRTTTWTPLAQTYQLIEGYHFQLQNGNTVDTFDLDSFSYTVTPAYQHPMYYLLETWDENAPVVILQLLNDAERILANRNYAGEGIDHLRAVYEKYYWVYGYTGQPMTNWPYPSLRKFHPAMNDLYAAIQNVANSISVESTS